MQGYLHTLSNDEAGGLRRTVVRLVVIVITIPVLGKKHCVDFSPDQAENAAVKEWGIGEGVAAAAPASGEA